jgi:hypothetical protein
MRAHAFERLPAISAWNAFCEAIGDPRRLAPAVLDCAIEHLLVHPAGPSHGLERGRVMRWLKVREAAKEGALAAAYAAASPHEPLFKILESARTCTARADPISYPPRCPTIGLRADFPTFLLCALPQGIHGQMDRESERIIVSVFSNRLATCTKLVCYLPDGIAGRSIPGISFETFI